MSRSPEDLDPITTLSMNLKEMAEIRAIIGRPKLDSDKEGAVELAVAAEKLYLEWMTMRAGSFSEDVQRRVQYQVDIGLPKTPAIATCGYLVPISTLMVNTALTMILQGEMEIFYGATLMDFEKGFTVMLGAVTNASMDSQKPKTEEDFLSRFDRRFGYTMIDVAMAEKAAQRPLSQAVRLLKKDPTGFSILRWQRQQLEMARDFNDQGILIRSFEVPEIVIAGAKFAQAKYQDLYLKVASVLE